jgi:hypothetical protein
MSDDDHRELAEVLKSLSGMVIVSGYRCALYDELFDGWRREEKAAHADGARPSRMSLDFAELLVVDSVNSLKSVDLAVKEKRETESAKKGKKPRIVAPADAIPNDEPADVVLTTKAKTGRPKGSRDKTPRKKRTEVTGVDRKRKHPPRQRKPKSANPIGDRLTQPGKNGGTLLVGGGPGRPKGTINVKKLFLDIAEETGDSGKSNAEELAAKTWQLAKMGSPFSYDSRTRSNSRAE